MRLDVVELFAGVGGFRVGLNNIQKFDSKTGRAVEDGPWKFVWANQWEPSTKAQPAFDCYVTRFGVENHVNEDINKIEKRNIPDHSLLVGGFPCQDYSVARTLSNELGIEGKKGVLWWDIVDVLYAKRTPFVLLENVDRLLKSPAKQRGRDFAVMLKTLEELGYIVQWRMINAGLYEMPQRRRRIFIFASHKDTQYSKKILNKLNLQSYLLEDGFFNDLFPISNEEEDIKNKTLDVYKDPVDVSDNYDQGKFLTSGIFINGTILNFDVNEQKSTKQYVLGDVIEKSEKYNENLADYVVHGEELEKWKYLKGSKRIERKRPDGTTYYYSEGQMSFPDNLDLPARTMLTSESTTNRSSHIIFDDKIQEFRKITEVEAELLQMFPPNWTNTGMSRRQRYFMMGNALVTGVVSMMEPKLRKIIESE